MKSFSDGGLAPQPLCEADEATLDHLIHQHRELEATARSLSERGYAIINLGLDTATLDAAATYTRDAVGAFTRVQDGWRRNRSVRDLAADPNILHLLETLYGRRPFPFQTLNFKFGSQQRTHSDTYHFNSVPARFMCGVWIALEDVGADAGPLHYYPGSHKLPIYERHQLPDGTDYAAYEDFVAEMMASHGFKREIATLKRGQAFLWSANLFHGGTERQNPKATRLSQVTHYYFQDCAYYTPLDSDSDRQAYWIRAPYDIARRRMVRSATDLLPGRASLRTRLAKRINVAVRRAPRS